MNEHLRKNAHRLTEAEKEDLWRAIAPSRAANARRPLRLAPALGTAAVAALVVVTVAILLPRGHGPTDPSALPAAGPPAAEKGVTVAAPSAERAAPAAGPVAPAPQSPAPGSPPVVAPRPPAPAAAVIESAKATGTDTIAPAAIATAAVAAVAGAVVERDTGRPLPLAEVVVDGTARGTVAAEDGRFVLAGLAPGRAYTVRARHLGYADAETTITAAADTVALAFALEPLIVATLAPFEVEGAKYLAEAANARTEGPRTPDGIAAVDPRRAKTAGAVTQRPGRAAREAAGAPAPASSGEATARFAPAAPDEAASASRFDRRRPPTWWIPREPGFDAMSFEHSGVNPFIVTERDALATFALDVDNASYTIARSYVERGALPPEAAVRVEEFVNFFDQGYAPPGRGDFRIVADGAPSPFGEGYHLLRVGLRARDPREEPRRPANLVFVVDVSGSMAREGRLELVKEALRLLLDELEPGDTVGIVAFTTDARVVIEPTGVARRHALEAALATLQPERSTNVEAGLRLGYRMARAHYRAGGINRLVLCSDGVANEASTRAEEILAHVRRESDGGIHLSAVGVGMGNYNDVLLERLADRGDGNYAYVDDLAEARRVFGENLAGTLRTVAEDAKVQVEFAPDAVERWRLIGYENRRVADEDFRDDAVDAGEVGAGHQVTALFEVKLTARALGVLETGRSRRDVTLANVRLRYRAPGQGAWFHGGEGLPPDGGEEHPEAIWRGDDDQDRPRDGDGGAQEVRQHIGVRDLSPRFADAPARLRLAAIVAEYAEILRGSWWARGSRLADLVGPARAVARALPQDEAVREFAQLVRAAARLEAARGWPDSAVDRE